MDNRFVGESQIICGRQQIYAVSSVEKKIIDF